MDEAFPGLRATIEPMPGWMRRILHPRVEAITLGSRVFVRPDRLDALAAGADPRLLAHELIHVEQWRQHGVVAFLVRYLTDYVRLRSVGCDHDTAYRHIGYEWAAYSSASRIVPGP